MIRSHILIGDEKALVAEMASSGPVHATEPSVRIDLTTPVSLKEITKAATHDLERQIILAVLKANGWNRRKTAKWLNISYRSLLYKLQDSQAGGVTETLPKATTVASISIPPGATATKEIQPMWTGKTSN
jgi:two-component system response regulator AtoC